ncbi:hypothetical protein STEG23_029476 [Scotinomys teguina]
MSAVTEKEPGSPDQEQEGSEMEHDAGQIVLHVLPIEEAVGDIDGTAALLVSQAVQRALIEEEHEQEEISPDIEEIWFDAQDIWPSFQDIWPDIEETWPDVEEDLYVWDGHLDNKEVQEGTEDQDRNNEEVEEDDNNDYEYNEEKEKEGEDEEEDQGKESICML